MLLSLNVTVFTHVLYVIVTFLCIFMMVWILVFPSALWYEHSTMHRTLLVHWFESTSSYNNGVNRGIGSVSSDLITKYQGQYVIQLLHIFPGAVWAAIVPLQLSTRFRREHPSLHKSLGYLFVGTACLVGMGVFVIIHKGLFFENFFQDLPPLTYSSSSGILLLTAYYLGTIFLAFYFVAFKSHRDFYGHSVWIVRHVASGIWIALQRILLGSPLYNQPPMTRIQQRLAFGHAALVSICFTILFGEILIALWDIRRTEGKKMASLQKSRKAL